MKLDKQTGWVESATRVSSPNCDERPADTPVDVIVVHCISLPPGEYGGGFIEQLFCNCLDPAAHAYFAEICHLQVSAHFLICRNGSLIQFVPTHKRAWHAGESHFHGRTHVNDFSLGIELEGTDDTPFTDHQYEMLLELTRVLMAAYPGIRKDKLVGHADVAPTRKSDPGRCFDWERYLKGV